MARRPNTYVGAAWRSRFLRAPKIALEFAVREDFTSLDQLGEFKLGIKTGADEFFFLKRLSPARKDDPRQGEVLKRPSGSLYVSGKAGWTGFIAGADLSPAILNPHEFIADGKRRFVVPVKTQTVYLSPKRERLRAQLKDYVRVGELAGVHRQPLVLANASEDAWYRQVRSSITSPWALPYNSAYEYSVLDNTVGAVLNGRFVGASPSADVDPDAFGAVLLSSFTLLGRLIEGMATGSEGAFDVGPPAVRRIQVPDLRRVNGTCVSTLAEIVQEIRLLNDIPAAPDRHGHVPTLRRRLDTAILQGLGATAGQATALLEKLYGGYGRWRQDIEDVEGQVRVNRREMSRTGQSRTISPEESIGRRIWEELQAGVRLFPSAVLPVSEPIEMVLLPPGPSIPTSEPLFDPGVITGRGRRRIDLKSFDRVRYVWMLREIGATQYLPVPFDPVRAATIVDAFIEDRGKLAILAAERARSYLSGETLIAKAIKVAERMWLNGCLASVKTEAPGT